LAIVAEILHKFKRIWLFGRLPLKTIVNVA